MLRTISKTIYPVIFILYIFITFASPLGMSFETIESVVPQVNNVVEMNSDTKYKLQTFAQVLGLEKTVKYEDEFSIHKYDDQKYKDYVFTENNENKSLSETTPSEYSYHKNPYNDKEVLGFLPYWQLSKYSSIDYSKLSTIAYFGLTSESTGRWVNDSGYTGFFSSSFDNMVALAHSKGTKVVIVVKNFDPYSIRRTVNNVEGAGDRLINNIVKVIRDNSLDGVNIDFEYVVKNSNDTVTNELRQAFVSWHQKLADAVHSQFPKAQVSTDVFGGSGVYYNLYDMEALGDTTINYIVMMTYDYITTSCSSGKIVTPMSPLYGNDGFNISSHLIAGAQKAGSKKIIMGVPYYGIDFQVKSADRDTYNARVDYPNCDGTIETYASIVDSKFDQYHNANTIKWNNTEKARWYSYSVGGKYRQGYYDDARSLGAKYDFVRSSNLGGIGIWALGYDNNAKELYDVIREKFQIVPFYINFGYGVPSARITSILNANNLTVVSEVTNSIYLVLPESEISGNVIKRIKMYKEVVDVRFEIVNATRGIN